MHLRCFGAFNDLDLECKNCGIRVDCGPFTNLSFECSKTELIDAKCWECYWRVFCEKKNPREVVVRRKPQASVVGVDSTKDDSYRKDNERIKKEFETKRDPW